MGDPKPRFRIPKLRARYGSVRLSKPYRVDPSAIRFKISPHTDLSGTQGGDWDLERRFCLSEAVKHRSLAQRYRDGMAWEDTDLFREVYSRRIQKESIRGEPTLKSLLAQYYSRVDEMFVDMKRRGFVDTCGPLPLLLIGRDQVFIGNQGNHRLAMAQILGLKTFAGKVLCRHPLSPR